MSLILGINGSNHADSASLLALKTCLDGAEGETRLISLSELQLPLFNPDEDYSNNKNVKKLISAIEEADGIVLCTPEYHGTMTGVLKNALDFTEIKHWKNKVVGFIGLAGGRSGAMQSIMSMMLVAKNLEAWSCPLAVSIPKSQEVFVDGTLKDKELEKRLKKVGFEVGKWAEIHKSSR